MKTREYLQKIFGFKSHLFENERIKLIQKMKKSYEFLESEFNFKYSLETESAKYPGGPKYYINKYTKCKTHRQIVVVLHRNSTLLHFYLKRLQNGIEPSYSDNDNCFSFYEIDIYNCIDNYDRHNPYLPPDYEFTNVKVVREILKSIPNILNGIEWFDRAKLDKIFLETKGYKSGHFDNPIFNSIKKMFSFLEDDFKFKIIYDYDKLRTFEQNLGGQLIYSNDKLTIVFTVDFRDQDFCIYLVETNKYNIENYYENGERVGCGQTVEKDFEQAKRQLQARIKNYYS